MSSAYAEINLDAARYNLQKVRNYAPKAKVMAVIKANAYGHGVVRIAEALTDADAFAVARVDEGMRLRKAGITNRIAVLQGFSNAEELQLLVDYQLETVVHSHHQLALLERQQGNYQLTVWLKIDTGMNRLGFKLDDVDTAYSRLEQCEIIKNPIHIALSLIHI